MGQHANDTELGRTSGSRSWLAGWVIYACAVVCSTGALVLVDRSDSDAANQVALLLLLMCSAALGWLRPRQAWLSALIVGCAIAVARAIALLLDRSPADPQAPHSLPAVASLLVLVVPAAVASYVGAAARRAVTKPSSTPDRP
jgi:hypothetical protein